MWADTLTAREVEETLKASDQLANVTWAKPLLENTESILDRLRVGITDKVAFQANPLLTTELPFLFEIRFARALAATGLTARYEYSAGVGESSVDFRVDLDQPWLIELVSLRESVGIKTATNAGPVTTNLLLRTPIHDPELSDEYNKSRAKQSEEYEMIKAQQRIAAKACDRNLRPIKFPEPNGAIHVIIVDARGFLGIGTGDEIDWNQIAFGPTAVKAEHVRYWKADNTGGGTPIKGLFEPGCPLQAAPIVQARVHMIGFICEKTFSVGEIKQKTYYCCNPALLSNEEASAIMARWPLSRCNAAGQQNDWSNCKS